MANLSKDFSETDQYELEAMIDKYSLQSVLYALQRVALDKADHILESYNDKALYKAWLKSAGQVATVAAKIATRWGPKRSPRGAN